jgi:hypothetical protein
LKLLTAAKDRKCLRDDALTTNYHYSAIRTQPRHPDLTKLTKGEDPAIYGEKTG